MTEDLSGIENGKTLVLALLKTNNVQVPAKRMAALEAFLQEERNRATIAIIVKSQEELMNRWKLEERIAAINEQTVRIPNGTVGKPYHAAFDPEAFNWQDVNTYAFEGLEAIGLQYDASTKQITGIPTQSGDLQVVLLYKVEGQPEDAAFHKKQIPLIVNPDPKSLWKNLESDRTDPFWKEDDVTVFTPLGDRHLLVSSKRGRSHANVGSFREDDFSFKDLEHGWSAVVVSDGAGSAKLSRQGSAIACQEVIQYFSGDEAIQSMKAFDGLLEVYNSEAGEEVQQKINHLVYSNLGKAAFHVYKKLEAFAAAQSVTLKDLSNTLVFTLFKKYERGYAVLSFGVGDCPMGLLNRDVTNVTLLNWIDVGEFGGGTRFITMAEIFQNEKFATRFGFRFVDDFSYLILMSDGIYDPKFVVENNLLDVKNWQAFLADLNGNNPEGHRVELHADNKEITEQLSKWMDFWSPGNHDDRTLAIIF
jgi:serine/threonine protein phosphatase PrpC